MKTEKEIRDYLELRFYKVKGTPDDKHPLNTLARLNAINEIAQFFNFYYSNKGK